MLTQNISSSVHNEKYSHFDDCMSAVARVENKV